MRSLKKINTHAHHPLIVVLRGVTPNNVVEVATMCCDHGLTTLEVTLNSLHAFVSIEKLTKHFGTKLLVGAGTVTSTSEVEKVKSVGGKFVVSPNCNIEIIKKTKQLGMLSFPGVLTPSEAFAAIESGADGIKLFPAVVLQESGIKTFTDVLPPHIPLYAVGGIAEKNFNAYIKNNCFGFGIGGNLFSPSYALAEINSKAQKITSTYVSEIHEDCKTHQLNAEVNELGEGPCWNNFSGNLHWIDIKKQTLYTANGFTGSYAKDSDDGTEIKVVAKKFDLIISSLAVINAEELLIASENGLFSYHLKTQERKHICDVEENNSKTRSNDGRTDRNGCFWFGTMGKNAELNAGAIYHYDGKAKKLTKVFSKITIPNSLCFSPNGKTMYFADTAIKTIFSCALGENGFPIEDEKVFAKIEDGSPDGSVVDSKGNIWNAQWGASRVVKYLPSGFVAKVVYLPAKQPTCPVFVGLKATELLVTSAYENLEVVKQERDGGQFLIDVDVAGVHDVPFKM